MLCYKDMTFCSKVFNNHCIHRGYCVRVLTSEIVKQAEDFPICSFAEEPECFEKVDWGMIFYSICVLYFSLFVIFKILS